MPEKDKEIVQPPTLITPTPKSIETSNRYSSLLDQTSDSSRQDSQSEIIFEEISRSENSKMSEDVEIKYLLNEDLEDLLRDIFEIRREDSGHELLQALAYDGITAWKTFRRMQPEAIDSLTKKTDRDKRVGIGKSIKMQLNILLNYIRDMTDKDKTTARDIGSFSVSDFEDYSDNYLREKQDEATSGTATNTPPPTTGSNYNSRSRTEKALDNWDKKKLDKTNFDILKEDGKYKVWRESFVAEVKVQGLTRLIDPEFNPKKKLQDQYDKELYEKQSNYMWTVLLYALRNPVAEVILGKHRDESDARTAFLAVDQKMKGKVPQMYNVSDLSKTLRGLHISTYPGNRVQFIAHWFETLRQLNKVADAEDRLTYVHVRSIIMEAINTDRDLTNSFTELQEEPDRHLATTKLMDHLLEKAMLYDGRDGTAASSDKHKLSALLHHMGLDDIDILINKMRRNGPPPDCKLPDDVYSQFTPDDKRQWRGFSDDAKRAVVRSISTAPSTASSHQRQTYEHNHDNAFPVPPAITYGDTTSQHTAAYNTVTALRHTLRAAEEHLRSFNADGQNSQAFTAMSSISSQTRPPDNSPGTDKQEDKPHKDDRPKKSSMSYGHPTRVMADTEQARADPEHDIKQRSVQFHGGYKQFQHHLFYDSFEQQQDLDDTTPSYNDITYTVTERKLKNKPTMALADRGANGCVGGDDCNIIGTPIIERKVHITGMGNHQVRDIPIATVGSYVLSNRGPVICIFNEVAFTGRGQSIISSIQLEHYKNRVDDRVLALGGGQQITTADGYNFPLSIINGLPYLQMRKFTQHEYDNLPHVIMTSEQIWDPRLYDNYIDPKSNSYKQANPTNKHLLPYDDYDVKGEYIDLNTTDTTNQSHDIDLWFHESDYNHAERMYRCAHAARLSDIAISNEEYRHIFDTEIDAQPNARTHIPTHHDYERLKPYFAWIPTKLIKHTFENSTQYGFMPSSPEGNLFKRWKSPNPAMNIFRLQDDVLTDKVHSNTPAIDGGFKAAQIFFGRKSHIIHVESIHKTKSFLSCLQNFVRKWGAPSRILADHISYHSSFKILDYLRMLWIQLWFSEAYYQHQNPFERRYQTFKRVVNRTMDRTSTPSQLWFLCMSHVAYVLNRISDPTLNYRQPITVATGEIADISALTTFQWLEPVYFKRDSKEITFPDTGEGFGYYVGVAENVGHSMTYKIWKKDTNKIIERSSVRSAWDERFENNRAEDNDVEDVSSNRNPHKPNIGDRVAKTFDDVIYFGTVRDHWTLDNKPLWKILYDDGDLEDLDSDEFHAAIALYRKHSGLDTHTSGRTSDNQDNGENSTFQKPTDHIFTKDVGLQRPGNAVLPDSVNYGERAYLGDSGSEYGEIHSNSHENMAADDGYPMVILLDDDGNPKLDSQGQAILIPGKKPSEIQGISFKHRQDDGEILRARVLGPDETNLESPKGKHINDKFRIRYDRTQVEDTMSYNDIMNYIHREQVEDSTIVWKLRRVLSHRPVNHRDPNYKNSTHNVYIEWENGEVTEESLTWMIKEDPIPMAQYAMDHNLLQEEGWKRLRRVAQRAKLFKRLVRQAKLRSFRTAPKYMYGFQVPRNFEEAMEFDKRNNNTRWADATVLEMNQLHDYKTFLDKGLYDETKLPKGFKRIKVHLVYAVKHDGRHKARLVADGHLTDVPLDSVYAGVVSIRGLRMCLFLAELNNLEAYATDIGNAYLEAFTHEKVCIKAGPEFGELEGHLLIIHKALYGLRSSGKRFGDLLAACLIELGFKPSRAEPQIFLRRQGDVYEYIATYVDDLCLVMKDPESFLTTLQSEPYSFKLKGSGPMSFHLGCGFERDDVGTLCMNPIKYIEKMGQAYEQLFGVKPGSKPRSPLEDGDHPELDTSEFLDEDDIQKYQSLIGSMQWLVTLGRWDIQTAVMTLSSFRAKPRKGHLQRARRICEYVNRFRHYKIRFRTDEPDLSHLDGATKVDWSKDVYEEDCEQIPDDAPDPLGKKVTLVHWFDANLMHDVLSGKAVTGCVHFANKTPIMWYSKKQATSETATYGAEFCAGRTCIEQIVDLRNSFRYLGVPVHDISYVFGDNKSMIDSSTYPDAKLHKRHNILSFHFVRSMIARGFIALTHVNSKDNLADVVTKHWGYNSVKDLLKPVFNHMGNTGNLYVNDD